MIFLKGNPREVFHLFVLGLNHVVEQTENLEIEVLAETPFSLHTRGIRLDHSTLPNSTFLIHFQSESCCFYKGWLLELNIMILK